MEPLFKLSLYYSPSAIVTFYWLISFFFIPTHKPFFCRLYAVLVRKKLFLWWCKFSNSIFFLWDRHVWMCVRVCVRFLLLLRNTFSISGGQGWPNICQPLESSLCIGVGLILFLASHGAWNVPLSNEDLLMSSRNWEKNSQGIITAKLSDPKYWWVKIVQVQTVYI